MYYSSSATGISTKHSEEHCYSCCSTEAFASDLLEAMSVSRWVCAQRSRLTWCFLPDFQNGRGLDLHMDGDYSCHHLYSSIGLDWNLGPILLYSHALKDGEDCDALLEA